MDWWMIVKLTLAVCGIGIVAAAATIAYEYWKYKDEDG